MQVNKENIQITSEQFLSAISIYLHKPHVVNKRVTTVRFALALSRSDRQYFNGRNLIDRRCLISKNQQIYSDQDELILTEGLSIEFRPILSENCTQKSSAVRCLSYRFEYFPEQQRIQLNIDVGPTSLPKETIWLRDVLLEKIVKWSQIESKTNAETNTLTLISVENYQQEYQRLKTKYGTYLRENWCESTDPDKHVFEDLGIASYLLTYWRENPAVHSKPIKFVDLGCGNGLLTFLLNSEGFSGVGIDARRRRSWTLYDPSSSIFSQMLIEPRSSEFQKFIIDNQFNFLIGNHSDELTPWLPILGALCHCNVFLLPCCFYDFSGKKFQTSHHEETSQYEQYLSYLDQLIRSLEFDVQRDKLRIPSTKNISFFLRPTNQHWTKSTIREKILTDFSIDIDLEHAERQETARERKPDFYSMKFSIIKLLFNHLLNGNDSLTLNSAFEILPDDLQKALKNERGGLKSMILSYRHALKFDTREKRIFLANPLDNAIESKINSVSKGSIKTKPCFFHQFHPSGCPLTDDQCAFSHE